MGRKTWESIPEQKRPLPNRLNIILTRDGSYTPTFSNSAEMTPPPETFSSLGDSLSSVNEREGVAEIFVIGGQALYEEALSDDFAHLCKLAIVTRINREYEADVFMPPFEDRFEPLFISQTYSQPADQITFDYCFFGNKQLLSERPDLIPTKLMEMYPKHPEMQYLEIIREVIATGSQKGDRTGTGVLSKFGYQMRYDLSESFPLLTTKDVFWRGVAQELIWFLKGDTNAKHLNDMKIRIWDGNASREYLDSIGLNEREEWDLGPVYGFQWRHFGA